MKRLAPLLILLSSLTLANPPALAPLSQPFGKDPLRELVTIPAGRYLVTEPITIDPGLAYLGGQPYHTRGWGPVIDLRGVVFVVSPDFQGDRVLDIVGTHPIIEGGTIDARWKAVDYGVVFRAKVNPLTGRAEATGGRGAWRQGGILGVFSKSALYLDSAEELTFEINVVNQGAGNGVTLANGGDFAPAWSMTMALFDGCSIQAYGNDVFRVVGDVMDCAVRDSFLASPKNALSVEGTGRRNRFDGVRFECSKSSTIIRGGGGWSRGSTVLNVSPIVSGWTARDPQAASTFPVVGQ